MGQELTSNTGRPRLGKTSVSIHAAIRIRQRAIPQFVIDALQDFGDMQLVGQGCESFYFTGRSWKRFMAYMGPAARSMDRFRDAYVIVADDGTVVTVAWRH